MSVNSDKAGLIVYSYILKAYMKSIAINIIMLKINPENGDKKEHSCEP